MEETILNIKKIREGKLRCTRSYEEWTGWYEEHGFPWLHSCKVWPNREEGWSWYITVRLPLGRSFQIVKRTPSRQKTKELGLGNLP